MKFRNLILTGAALLMAVPTFASTYYGGFEDLSRSNHSTSDYDYNDVIFSLSGSSLQLKTSDGAWYSNPTIDMNGKPFWDNTSWDGGKKNVGYCIYGGGDCGKAIAPGSQFLASKTSPNASAQDVYFTMGPGNVTASVRLNITSATDTLYWYTIGDQYHLHTIGTGVGTFAFDPSNSFGLAGYNNQTRQYFFSSDCNDPSNFAFFQPTPEPGTMGAMAGGLIVLGTLFRRRKISTEQK